jgi:protocatechuate 3,4-dioxygenase alpha subunit
MPGITPSATVGPFFLFGLVPSTMGGRDIVTNNLLTPDVSGERIRIDGMVYDGDGVPVPDALIEIWQADGAGRYASAAEAEARSNTAFKGFGRCPTDAAGAFAFDTVKPGPVPGPEGATQAPHIAVNVFARGVVKQMVTRVYFSDDGSNVSDPVLGLVPPERRGTLIAERHGGDSTPGVTLYRFDIRLQGENETVFFEA